MKQWCALYVFLYSYGLILYLWLICCLPSFTCHFAHFVCLSLCMCMTINLFWIWIWIWIQVEQTRFKVCVLCWNLNNENFPVANISSKWQHFHFSVLSSLTAHSSKRNCRLCEDRGDDILYLRYRYVITCRGYLICHYLYLMWMV